MSFFGSGRNPGFGPDHGLAPPNSRQPYGVGYGYGFGHAYPPQPAGYYPALYQQQQYYYNTYGRPYCMPGQGGYMMPGQGGYTTTSANPTQFAQTGQAPAGNPIINSSIPAVNMTNSTGGVGCEPGYNYFFPPEHTKIQVFMTGDTAPWQVPPNVTIPFHSCHVPCNTTIGQLLMGFGACNPEPELNRVFECHQGGNGRWYKGLMFRGDNKDDMKKTIKEVGWDPKRNGLPGGRPVVSLYIVKG